MTFFKYFLKRKTKIPRVIIKHGRLIDPIFTFYSQNSPDVAQFGWNTWTPPSQEELKKRIKTYREEWRKYKIIEDLQQVLGISFERNIIDVYIVSGISRPTSHPLIIKSGYTPKEFVTTLAHELIHVILSDNKIKKNVYDSEGSETMNSHVIVYAVLKKILNEDLWETERKLIKTEDYRKALEYMEKIGPDQAIKMMTG